MMAMSEFCGSVGPARIMRLVGATLIEAADEARIQLRFDKL
jgi:hypothetical protein